MELCRSSKKNSVGTPYYWLIREELITQAEEKFKQECIRKRVLRYFGRRGWFDKETIAKMLTYENSGFSLDAKVRIQSWDREGLERLIRYCARPCFASSVTLRRNGPWLVYRLPKPTHTGKTFIQLEPLEFIERISAFIPVAIDVTIMVSLLPIPR